MSEVGPNQRLILEIYLKKFTKLKTFDWRRSSLNPMDLPLLALTSDSTNSLNPTEQEKVGDKNPLKLDILFTSCDAIEINHEDICRMYRLHNVLLQTNLFLEPKDLLFKVMPSRACVSLFMNYK